MTQRRASLLAIAALACTACLADPAPAPEQAQPPGRPSPAEPSFEHLREVQVEVTSGGQSHRFRAWVAETPATRARGLMFVHELPPQRGMLFLFEVPQFASFWMRNTYIPLDLMFVAGDGTIVNIAENATPHSLALLESIAPVTAVLEVAGGTAARLGIRAGARARVVDAPDGLTR